MRIGEEIKRNNRIFMIVDILPKHRQEYDMIVCEETVAGYKECFQRYDLLGEERIERRGRCFDIASWSPEELMLIKKWIKEGRKYSKLGEIPGRTPHAVKLKYSEMRKKMYYSGEITKEEFLNTYTMEYKGGFVGE